MRYLIIGAGGAGVKTAELIRKYNKNAKIEIITAEEYPPYSKTLLINYICGKLNDLTYKGLDFFRQNDIKLSLNTKAIGIDERKNVVFTNRGKRHYDVLIITTGSLPVVPNPCKGINDKIFTLSTLQDAIKIKQQIKKVKSVMILGAGLIGCELIDVFSNKNLKITLVEKESHVLPKTLDEVSASILQGIIREKGISLKFNTTIKNIDKHKDKLCIELNGKQRVEADILIVACGVEPNIEFLKQSNVKINTGVIVNKFMQTNIENIYSAGDVCESYDLAKERYQVNAMWPNAIRQAEVLAMNLSGLKIEYEGSISLNTSNIFGLTIFSAGNVDAVSSETIVKHLPEQTYYEKFVILNGVLVGYIKLQPQNFKSDLKNSGMVLARIGKKVECFPVSVTPLPWT